MKKLLLLLLLLLPMPALAGGRAPRILFLLSSAREMKGHPTGVWFEEHAAAYAYFRKLGYQIDVASPKGNGCVFDLKSLPTGTFDSKWAEALKAMEGTRPIARVHAADYDGLYCPGGHGPMVDLATDKEAGRLIGEFWAAGKPVAAVCHGPAALLTAVGKDGQPLVAGKKMTAFTNDEEAVGRFAKVVPFLLETELRRQGAVFENTKNFESHVVVDGKLITGQNPASTLGVAEALAKMLPAPDPAFDW